MAPEPEAADRGRTVVIAGASVAGTRCAIALRNAGFDGEVVLFDAESGDPYDKPQLSKKLGDDHQLELLAEQRTLRDAGIDFRPGITALALDVDARRVETSAGPIAFDELVIATGCRPRALPYSLPARAGYIRTRHDGERLRLAAREGGRLVVLGGGFLGLEATAAAVDRGMTATVVDVAPQVLSRGIPGSAASVIAARHAAAGVDFRLGVTDPVLAGDDHLVRIGDLVGDYAIASIGAVPNVEWLADSGLAIDNGVVCDATLSAAPGVWAVGDCARWVNARYRRLERHEHWTTAARQGQHVASCIARRAATPMSELPYIWSDQFDWKIQTVGRIGVEEAHFAIGPGQHVVLCLTDGMVTGVTTINAQARCVRARQLLQRQDAAFETVVAGLGLADVARMN